MQKRTRAGKLNREPVEQSPTDPDAEDSFDDFEEVRPKIKRNRAVEASTSVNFEQISLIGIT